MAKGKDIEEKVAEAQREIQGETTDFRYQIFWVILFLSVFIIAAFGLIAEA